MANHFSIVALRTHEPMKREKYMILDDENPKLVGVQYATGEEQRNSSRKNEEAEPEWKQCQVLNVSVFW